MSEWNNKLPEFIALLDDARGEGFWVEDFDLKYLTIRIDTRDNGWLLFVDGKGGEKVQIEPQRVVDAIEKHRARYGRHKTYDWMVKENDAGERLAEPHDGADAQSDGGAGEVG